MGTGCWVLGAGCGCRCWVLGAGVVLVDMKERLTVADLALPPDRLAAAQAGLAGRGLPALTVVGAVEPPGPTPLWLRHPDGRREPLAPGASDHFARVGRVKQAERQVARPGS